jgi:Mrr N-terminal domain
MKLEDEKRFALLAAILDLGGKGSKAEVLDRVAASGYLRFLPREMETMPTRDEVRWRNDLAYVRKHLVQRQYLKGMTHNSWEISERGNEYFKRLCANVSAERSFHKLAPEGIARARATTDS